MSSHVMSCHVDVMRRSGMGWDATWPAAVSRLGSRRLCDMVTWKMTWSSVLQHTLC